MGLSKPKEGDVRMRETTAADGGPFYVAEQFRRCDCPRCETDGHWCNFMGSPIKPAVSAAATVRQELTTWA